MKEKIESQVRVRTIIVNGKLSSTLMGWVRLSILALAFAACSSSDDEAVVPVPETTTEPETLVETAISFSGHEEEEQLVSRAMTRAGAPLSESATAFKVWGHKSMHEEAGVYSEDQTVFPGYTVTWYSNSAASTTSNSSNWEYVTAGPPAQTIKYWDWSAAAYRFYAVTGEAAADDAALTANPAKYLPSGSPYPTSFKLITDATSSVAMNTTPFFTRLWFSTGKLPEYASKQFGKPVVLEFLKPYARVRFIFKYVFAREAIFLDEVSFKPTDGSKKIARKGTVTVSYPLDGTGIKETYTATGNNEDGVLTDFTIDYDPEIEDKDYVTLSGGKMTEDGWYIVVPNTAQGSYTLSATINGVGRTASVPAEFMQWLPGYSYTYIFKILDEGGVKIDLVETAVTPWTELYVDHEVYNW